MIGASTGRVYGVSFPEKNIISDKWDVAVEITDESIEFDNEVRALQAITINGSYIGHWSCSDDKPL